MYRNKLSLLIVLVFIFGNRKGYACLRTIQSCAVVSSYDSKKKSVLYELSKGIDLNGDTLQIPNNSKIRLNGHSINNGLILLGNNVVFNGSGAKLYTHPEMPIIVANGNQNIIITNCEFIFKGNRHLSYEYAGVVFKNCVNVDISRCTFLGDEYGESGYMGLAMVGVTKLNVYDNIFRNFYQNGFWDSKQRKTAWATYLSTISQSKICHNFLENTYSGIKLTGFIDHVKVDNNMVRNSITDGCDFAGISANNILISRNSFRNCGDCGIEFKILFYNEWHVNEMSRYYAKSFLAPRFFKNITISFNQIDSWVGIRLWNQYSSSNCMSNSLSSIAYDNKCGNIRLIKNKLEKTSQGSGNPNSDVGIQICYNAERLKDFQVKGNNILGFKYGVYFVNSSNILIKNNNIQSVFEGIYERIENHVDLIQQYNSKINLIDNRISSHNTSAISLSERTSSWLLKKNEIEAPYTIKILNKGINNIISD